MMKLIIAALCLMLVSPAWAQKVVIPNNGGKPLAEAPDVAKAREAEYAKKRTAYKALLQDAMAKAAEAKMQADTERLARLKKLYGSNAP